MNVVRNQWREFRVEQQGKHCFLPYYTTNPWHADENGFYFFSALPDFSRIWLNSFDTDRHAITEHGELSQWREAMREVEARLRRNMPGTAPQCCFAGTICDESLLHGVFAAKRRKAVIPCGPRLFEVDLDTGVEKVVYDFQNPDYRLGGPGAINREETQLLFGAYTPLSTTPDRNLLLQLDASDYRELARVDFGGFFANHFQFTGRQNLILYAHEGRTEGIPDRMNLLDLTNRQRRILYSHATDAETGAILECIGHEFASGNKIATVRYAVSPGLPGAVLMLNTEGECITLDEDDYFHCSINRDGSILVADTMWWGKTTRKTDGVFDVIRLDLNRRTKEILKTVRTDVHYQFRHVHPQTDRAGNRVLFGGDSAQDAKFSGITMMQLQSNQ